MGMSERVADRFLARKKDTLVPVINKDKDRIVYVLPETAEEETGTYEKVPSDDASHVKYQGKPRRPDRPAKPKLPHKPDIPRATTPAPARPPRIKRPVLPAPPVPTNWVHPVHPTKDPSPREDPRKWKVHPKAKPLQ